MLKEKKGMKREGEEDLFYNKKAFKLSSAGVTPGKNGRAVSAKEQQDLVRIWHI